MIYVGTAVMLILASSAVAVGAVSLVGAWHYPDVMLICRQLGRVPDECASDAVQIGLLVCASALIILILLSAASRRFPSLTVTHKVSGRAFLIAGTVVIVVTAYSVAAELVTPLPLYQDEYFLRFPAVISLGNLLWPLCLQLANVATTWKWRVAFLALIAPIIAFSPFRGVLFAVAVFGVLLPLLEQAVRRAKRGDLHLKEATVFGAVAAAVAIVTVILIGITTLGRPTSMQVASEGAMEQVAAKLGQRVIIPLYQAAYADGLRLQPEIPTPSDELLAKLRLRKGLSINGYLYARTHEGERLGETTSLYFGEAVLRTDSPPIVWMVTAPWLLIGLWILLRRLGYDASTLTAISIWRGSLGGLVAIVPALAIQIFVYVALCGLRGTTDSE